MSSSLSDSITILKSQLDAAEKEIQALQSGKKASSSRARKSLMSVKTGSHDLRKQITGFAKALPTKSRVKKTEAEPEPEPEPVEEPPKPKPKRRPRKKVESTE